MGHNKVQMLPGYMIFKCWFNSIPFILLLRQEEEKGVSSEPAGFPSKDLNSLFYVQLYFILESCQRIFAIAEQAMNSWSISPAKNTPPFHSHLHHLCVPDKFPHILEDPVQVSLSFYKFPWGPTQKEVPFPGYAAQVCADSPTNSSCFILGSCLHVCLSLWMWTLWEKELFISFPYPHFGTQGLEHSRHLVVLGELN